MSSVGSRTDNRKHVVPAQMPRAQFRRGKLVVDIVHDRRGGPLFLCVVQEEGSRKILFLGQFRSQAEAEWAALEYISDLVSLRSPAIANAA